MKVKATNKYKELNVSDKELGRMPTEGEEFEVTEERYKELTETNKFNTVFVEKVEEAEKTETATKNVKAEAAVKKTTKKTTAKNKNTK